MFRFATNASGEIISWNAGADAFPTAFNTRRDALSVGDTGTNVFGHGSNTNTPGVVEPGHRHAGRGVYPIIDDADRYGVGSSGPAVPAGSGLTAPGLGRSSPLAFRHQARYIG